MSVADDYDHGVEALYRKSHGTVVGYLINMGTDRGLAEEITSDAFLVARRNWQRLRSSYRCPEGYIFMVRNERSKRQRRQDLHARDLLRIRRELQRRQVADPTEHIIDRIILMTALQGLPERLREAGTPGAPRALAGSRHTAPRSGPVGGDHRRDNGDQLRHGEALYIRWDVQAAVLDPSLPPHRRGGGSMSPDKELLISSLARLGDSDPGDAELEHRAAAFENSLRRLPA